MAVIVVSDKGSWSRSRDSSSGFGACLERDSVLSPLNRREIRVKSALRISAGCDGLTTSVLATVAWHRPAFRPRAGPLCVAASGALVLGHGIPQARPERSIGRVPLKAAVLRSASLNGAGHPTVDR
jgi:hypothetical protein